MESLAELRQFEILGAREGSEELGRGAYGVVKVFELEGKSCAGKVVHEWLRSAGGDPVRRYVEECKLMVKDASQHRESRGCDFFAWSRTASAYHGAFTP